MNAKLKKISIILAIAGLQGSSNVMQSSMDEMSTGECL